jgi:LPXTG-motif cell wall-anchored protein
MRRVAVWVAMVLTGALVVAVGSAGAAAADGTTCTPVIYSWSGRTSVDPGQSFHTGALVPAQVGMQLAVNVFDVSTDDPAPGAISLWIGDTAVANGTAIVGGEIGLTNQGTVTVVVTRVEISVDQCVQVAASPPVAGATDPAVTVPAVTVPGVTVPGVTVPAVTVPASVELPATGRSSAGMLAAAALATGLGVALLWFRRRQADGTLV